LDIRWDTHCPSLVEARKREAEWKEKEQHWATAPMNSDAGWNVSEDDSSHQLRLASEEKLFMTCHVMSQGVWPSVERGVEVSIEVHLDLKDSEKERPACRLLVFIGYLSVPDLLSFLCHSAVGTSGGSCTSFGPHCGTYSFVVSCEYASYHLVRGSRN
jgi:hypothetical protein